MYSCEQLVVASSLGAIAVSAALVAVLCCTRRPPEVGNTPLVLLLVSLLAIAATLAAAAGDDEPPPRKVSRLTLTLRTLQCHLFPWRLEQPEDDGEDADDEGSTSKTANSSKKPARRIQYKITLHLEKAPRTSGQRDSLDPSDLGSIPVVDSVHFLVLDSNYQTAPP
ncbi:hypothetical protein J6590_088391 [Homalodisca vitripennis]|nr:hypothetical protein J6590_088391 [Homalodisca vitripennis]